MSEDIRVGIVEDDSALREGLSFIIKSTPGYDCVGTFSSVEEALDLPADAMPDVLLLDINLPGVPGSEGVKLFLTKHPALRILMLTVYAEQERVFESICNGASGYVLKKTPPLKLLEFIREAYDGGAPMSPEIAQKVIAVFRQIASPVKNDYQLSPQETRLLKLLAEGHSYQSAAGQLNISVNTVRNHIRSIYEKLHVSSKSEAVSKALRQRIIS